MDDFFTYFLGGMLGEELMRKIATRPFGFMILWLIGFVLVNIFFIVILLSILIYALFEVEVAPQQTLLSSIGMGLREMVIFFAIAIQPWATFIALGGGLLFAIGYRIHYRNNFHEKENKTPS